jgi:hypothetical protein
LDKFAPKATYIKFPSIKSFICKVKITIVNRKYIKLGWNSFIKSTPAPTKGRLEKTSLQTGRQTVESYLIQTSAGDGYKETT